MAATMNFFRAQDEARGRTTKLVVLLVLAILVLTFGLYAIAVWGQGKLLHGGELDWFQPKLFFFTSGTALVVIIGGSLLRISELSSGGGAIAQRLGGRLVPAQTQDLAEKRYLNIVQEMALASGLPVPACYVLDRDESINAFAAGNDPSDAVVAVTRGALRYLTRDELQGVVAHEFSHIGNGDMKLNIRIIGSIAGLTALSQLGYLMMRMLPESDSDSAKVAIPLALAGLVVVLIGLGGVFFASIIQASVSRQREFLADASAVQFTRHPEGLASALKKVANHAGGKRSGSTADLESQHMFFASTGGFFETLFSSHPPLGERIKRIDPSFSGVIVTSAPSAEVSVDEAELGVSGLNTRRAAVAPPPLPTLPTRRVPTDIEIQEAVGFHGTLPGTLRIAASDPVTAMAIVMGLTLRKDETLRAQQLASAERLAGGEVTAEMIRLESQLRSLPAGSRLPLLDISMPAIRQLSPAQLELFRLAIAKVGYEAEDGLIVLLVQASMRRYLGETQRLGPPPLGDLTAAYSLVLSAVVQTSSESSAQQAAAYTLAIEGFGRPDIRPSMVPKAEVDLHQVDEALAVIAAQNVNLRRKFVRACGVAMLNDGRAEAPEVEIVRAVGDSLGITFATGV